MCVVGMHRSGTSCLTGSLQQAGLSLGPHSTWNRFNQRGNRENPEINRFHDDLLAANGGSWDRPPERLEWAARHAEWAREIISAYPSDRRWGFKDPKTLPALDGWRELLGNVQLIGIYRHPISVTRSLQHRNKLSVEHGLSLWQHYNALLLREHDRTPFPLFSFDWSQETFHARLNRVLPDLGLKPLAEEEEWFFTGELRHHNAERTEEQFPLPGEIEALYRELQERAVA